MALDPDVRPLEEPLAALERQLIDDYLRGAGHDPETLRTRKDASARKLLIDAALHASAKLTEIQSRSHYLHKLHGEE